MDDASQQSVIQFLKQGAAFLRQQAPNQLITVGTEGAFVHPPYNAYNPGAGTQCEGEDWLGIYKSIPDVDFATVHVYARQKEMIPPLWQPWDWSVYVNWAIPFIKLHGTLAKEMNMPLVIEEFGVTQSYEYALLIVFASILCFIPWLHMLYRPFTAPQAVAYFKMIYDVVKDSRAVGGPIMGTMFWNAALAAVPDYTG
jgi:mannan endo-1,4-beta-mannosidase